MNIADELSDLGSEKMLQGKLCLWVSEILYEFGITGDMTMKSEFSLQDPYADYVFKHWKQTGRLYLAPRLVEVDNAGM